MATVTALAARFRLPSRYFVQPAQNGLLPYGPSSIQVERRVANHVARILRGARPADLPVEQPTEFDLVITLRTAAALGVTVPATLAARADRVFE